MLDIKEIIGIITVVLGVIGYIPYLKDTVAGKTKPHVYTWFVWSLVAFIVFALQISDEAGAGAWVTLVAGILSFLIFLLGLKRGDKDITTSDTAFFIAALAALVLWLVAGQPIVSITLLVTVGILGFLPTLRKSWNKPHSETLSTYAINAARHGLSVFALSEYTVVTWLFPVAWGFANALFVLIILLRRNKKISSKYDSSI